MAIRRITTVEGMEAISLPLSLATIAGGFVFVSGQGPFKPRTLEIPDGFEDQVRLTLQNVERVLHSAGASLRDVAKVNAYLADLDDFAKLNEIYREFFLRDYPARTTVGANLLGIKVEIECIAVLRGDC
jgi:2-iminobutanoate/2-iminopropanoate deaminase